MKLRPVGVNQNELELDNETTIFFSYETPVAAFVPGAGLLRTSKIWSVTTSRHINKWLAGRDADTRPQEFFNKLAGEK